MVLVTYNTEKKSEYILTASTRIYTAKLSGLPLWGTDVMTPETKIHSVGDLMVDLLKKTENALANDFHYNETLRMEVYESIKEHFVQWPPQLK